MDVAGDRALPGLLTIGCSTDESAEIEGLKSDLAEVTAERDELQATVDARNERAAKTLANQERAAELLAIRPRSAQRKKCSTCSSNSPSQAL
jgi:hypothetical protein